MRRETHTKFWSESLKERSNLEDLGVDKRITFWLTTETGGEILWALWWSFGLHTRRGIYRL